MPGLAAPGSVDCGRVLAAGWSAELGGIMHAKPGDWLIVETSTLDRHSIRGRIEEVLSGDGQPPYRVRWTTDDHVGMVFPGPDARVVTDEHGGRNDRGDGAE
ncbi:MAG TPA: DUF1918 domain-containing protein [Pseudonocardiaceae bacterium]|nr:DUF1918 domain-containing protein [Pseudonocardiaceae bacterium]